jgi:endoglucanase
MKQTITVSLILILIHFLLISCKEPHEIQVDPSSIEIASDGGTVALTITTDSPTWEIENPVPEWISLSSIKGSAGSEVVTVTVSSRSLEQRTASFKIKAEDAQSVSVEVKQAASDVLYELLASVQGFHFDATGADSSFVLTTNAPNWSIKSSADWLAVSFAEGTKESTELQISVDENSTYVQREATVQILAEYAKTVTLLVTQESAAIPNTLVASKQVVDFKQAGGDNTFTVTTSAPQWELQCDADWLTINPKSGSGESTLVSVSAVENTTTAARTTTLVLKAPNTSDVSISVTQARALYPSYNIAPIPADMTGMERSATELAKAMTVGWNLGNTLEVPGSETGWGNPKATQRLIDSIYSAGFNAIRLPCAWDSYLENTATAKIKTSWLNRVKEVVDYCYKNNMYVVLNIHWDGGWLENNVNVTKQEGVSAKQKAYWEQIATFFRNYDEHLLFAGTNEPNVDNAAQMAVLLSHEQTFIDAVRATGGRNAYRTLIFQGPSTDIEKTNNLMKTLPTDQVQERLMAEVHYYTPWNFCGMEKDESWGKMFYYWGSNNHNASDPTRNSNYGEEAAVRSNFNKMKTQFVTKEFLLFWVNMVPFVVRILRARHLEKHLASRAYFLQVVTQESKNYGIVPFYWDNGNTGNNAFGLFYRSSGATFRQASSRCYHEGSRYGRLSVLKK